MIFCFQNTPRDVRFDQQDISEPENDKTQFFLRRPVLFTSTFTFTLLQDPVERSSCLDFYQLVLFYTTAGAALLGAVGVALLIFVKAVKRDKKEGRPIKAGAK